MVVDMSMHTSSMTSQRRQPPDGGFGWVVAAASLCVLTLRTGMTWVTFPILYGDLVAHFQASAAAVGWTASLFIFTSFSVCEYIL